VDWEGGGVVGKGWRIGYIGAREGGRETGWLQERYICWAVLFVLGCWGAECCVRYFCQLTSGVCDYCPHALSLNRALKRREREYAVWLRRRSRDIPRTDAVGGGICVRPTALFPPSLLISTSSGVDDWALFFSVVW